MSEEMKMSELFPFAFQVEHNKSFEVQDVTWYSYGEKYESDSYQDSAIERAVLNHDRLTEENQRLREALSDLTSIASHCHAVGVRLQPCQLAEISDARKLLEGLK